MDRKRLEQPLEMLFATLKIAQSGSLGIFLEWPNSLNHPQTQRQAMEGSRTLADWKALSLSQEVFVPGTIGDIPHKALSFVGPPAETSCSEWSRVISEKPASVGEKRGQTMLDFQDFLLLKMKPNLCRSRGMGASQGAPMGPRLRSRVRELSPERLRRETSKPAPEAGVAPVAAGTPACFLEAWRTTSNPRVPEDWCL